MSPTKHEDETAKEAIKPDFLQELGIGPEEQQEMEDAAYGGAAEDIAANAGLSNSEIQELETNPNDTEAGSDADEAESEGIPFREEEDDDSPPGGLRSRVKNLSRRAKAGIAGGVITGGVGIASFFGIGSFGAIHLLQTLAPDFTPAEESSDVRMNALFRYARSGGALGETRVSYWGSKKFASTRNQLGGIGVSFNENKAFGVQKGLVIETDKFPATKGLNREQAKLKLAEFYKDHGIKASDIKNVSGNKLYIDNRNLGISSTRGLVNKTVSQLDNGRTSTWLKARAIKRYYNLPSVFHPFKRIDAKITQSIEKKYTAREREKARKTGREYKSPSAEQAKTNLKENTKGVKAGAGAVLLLTSGICLARSAAEDAVTFNREAVVVPQALEAADAMAVGAQQMAGQDFGTDQLDAYNKLMSDEDGKTIWDARALQAKRDPTTSVGEDLPWEYGQAFSSGGTASTLSGLGGTFGAAACSPLGLGVQVIGGIALIGFAPFTGGGTAAAYSAVKIGTQAAVGAGVMIGLQNLLASALKDDPIPESISAPVRGNLLAYGSRELANITARGSGGVELSPQESAMLDLRIAAKNDVDFQAKSFIAKMFDAKDYRSVAGKAVDSYSSPKAEIQNIAQGFLNIGPMFASMFNRTSSSVHAAEPYNYGFNRYGIPQRLLNNDAYDDPYDNADKVAVLLESDRGQDYIDRAKECFNVTISEDSGSWGVEPGEGDINPNSKDYEEAHCSDAGDPNWDRMILFVNDTLDMEAAACYLGEDDSCEVIGVDVGDVEEGGAFGMRVASFNILHPPDGDVPQRLSNSIKTLLKPPDGGAPVDVAGLQEFKKEQIAMVKNKHYPDSDKYNLDDYEIFPFSGEPKEFQPNAIIWRKDKYTALKQEFFDAQYFGGEKEEFPVVKLKDNASGQLFYVMDIHSPRSGNGHGDNSAIRDNNAKRFQEYFANLKQQEPDTTMVLVGDFNAGYQAPPKGEGVEKIEAGRRAFCILTNGMFWDAWHASKQIKERCPRGSGVSYVDHIFVDRDTQVSKYFIAPRQVGGSGHNGSDHNTIFAIIGVDGASGGVDGWSWPLKKDINPGPCYGGEIEHAGMDMNSETTNNIVYAMHSGKVERQAYDSDAGNFITIKADAPFNGKQVYYSYEHLKNGSIGVKVGDRVTGGQAIAIAGLTGNAHVESSRAHLHIVTATTNSLGAYGNLGTTFDPMEILSKAGPAPEGYECIR